MLTEPLAKSNPQMSLRQHTHEVMEAVAAMTRLLQVPLGETAPKDFAAMLQIAAFFHDLGKAASGFQEVLMYKGDPKLRPKWGYRHETLSTAILLSSLPEQGDPVWRSLLITAVLTHHRNLDDEAIICTTGIGNDYEDFTDGGAGRNWRKRIAELRLHWQWVCQEVETARISGVIPLTFHSLPNEPHLLPNLFETGQIIEDTLQSVKGLTSETLPWILARGFLMGGDHLASAGHGTPLSELHWDKVRPAEGFQQRVAEVQGSVLIEAPTGSGKTEAALHWAHTNRYGGERIFYVLPYQASINKMDERLAETFGRDLVGMLHGRAALQEFARHFDSEESNYQIAADKAKARVDQTKQFYRPIKIITPYQLLKLMFGTRFFEIGLTELLGGLVIFDEIHAYDPHVAALIDVMLKRLLEIKVRFCFMTATFPTFLKAQLQESLGGVPVIPLDEEDERDKRLLKTARHYLCLHEDTLEGLTERIIKDAQTKKVLVVCNRIQQAQDIYQVLKDCELKIALLHSRFIARDRARLENELVAFPCADTAEERQIPAADILVATQVVEVSLNLSFDTIYTEVAPVDALLQRFGRVNRMNQHKDAVPVHVARHFDDKKVKHIYSLERITATLDSAPDNEELFPCVENNWVTNAYLGGYTTDEAKQYKDAHTAFVDTVGRLKPYYRGDDKDYYDLFDNYPVVPVRFRAAYRSCIQQKHYFEAAQFVASLPQSTFMGLADFCEVDTDNHVYYAERRYDAELGLLNEEEPDKTYIKEDLQEVCL